MKYRLFNRSINELKKNFLAEQYKLCTDIYSYNNVLLYDIVLKTFTNYLMKDGKKYNALKTLKEIIFFIKYNLNISPLLVIKTALSNCRYFIDIKIVKYRRKEYKYPVVLTEKKSILNSIKLLFHLSKDSNIFSKKSYTIGQRLAILLINTFFKRGPVFRYIKNIYYKAMRLRNKSFYKKKNSSSNRMGYLIDVQEKMDIVGKMVKIPMIESGVIFNKFRTNNLLSDMSLKNVYKNMIITRYFNKKFNNNIFFNSRLFKDNIMPIIVKKNLSNSNNKYFINILLSKKKNNVLVRNILPMYLLYNNLKRRKKFNINSVKKIFKYRMNSIIRKFIKRFNIPKGSDMYKNVHMFKNYINIVNKYNVLRKSLMRVKNIKSKIYEIYWHYEYYEQYTSTKLYLRTLNKYVAYHEKNFLNSFENSYIYNMECQLQLINNQLKWAFVMLYPYHIIYHLNDKLDMSKVGFNQIFNNRYGKSINNVTKQLYYYNYLLKKFIKRKKKGNNFDSRLLVNPLIKQQFIMMSKYLSGLNMGLHKYAVIKKKKKISSLEILQRKLLDFFSENENMETYRTSYKSLNLSKRRRIKLLRKLNVFHLWRRCISVLSFPLFIINSKRLYSGLFNHNGLFRLLSKKNFNVLLQGDILKKKNFFSKNKMITKHLTYKYLKKQKKDSYRIRFGRKLTFSKKYMVSNNSLLFILSNIVQYWKRIKDQIKPVSRKYKRHRFVFNKKLKKIKLYKEQLKRKLLFYRKKNIINYLRWTKRKRFGTLKKLYSISNNSIYKYNKLVKVKNKYKRRNIKSLFFRYYRYIRRYRRNWYKRININNVYKNMISLRPLLRNKINHSFSKLSTIEKLIRYKLSSRSNNYMQKQYYKQSDRILPKLLTPRFGSESFLIPRRVIRLKKYDFYKSTCLNKYYNNSIMLSNIILFNWINSGNLIRDIVSLHSSNSLNYTNLNSYINNMYNTFKKEKQLRMSTYHLKRLMRRYKRKGTVRFFFKKTRSGPVHKRKNSVIQFIE